MLFIEPLTWMFKNEYFKEHYVKLTILALLSWFCVFVLFFINTTFVRTNNNIAYLVLNIVCYIIFIIPLLAQSGYFWCLTENILNRKEEPILNTVYDGRVKTRVIIQLPEFDILRFIWRGIASIVASILMCIPLVLLLSIFVCNFSSILKFWNISYSQSFIIVIVLYLLFASLVPALSLNYAKEDSVFATLNFPRAIYIMGNYTGKYILNVFLMIAYSIIFSILLHLVMILLLMPITSITSSTLTNFNAESFMDYSSIIIGIVMYIIGIYWTFVHSYLLGTIIPSNDY